MLLQGSAQVGSSSEVTKCMKEGIIFLISLFSNYLTFAGYFKDRAPNPKLLDVGSAATWVPLCDTARKQAVSQRRAKLGCCSPMTPLLSFLNL